jgi:hypothetical protein
VACESGLMHEGAAQIISDVGLVYGRSFVMAWIALFSASLILGGVSACPAAGTYIAGAELATVQP